jgi:hypothetical protein
MLAENSDIKEIPLLVKMKAIFGRKYEWDKNKTGRERQE